MRRRTHLPRLSRRRLYALGGALSLAVIYLGAASPLAAVYLAPLISSDPEPVSADEPSLPDAGLTPAAPADVSVQAE